MFTFELPVLILESLLLIAVIVHGKNVKNSSAREPKLWHILLVTLLIIFIPSILALGSTGLLILIIATAVTVSWTYNRNKRKPGLPWYAEIREAIEFSEQYHNEGFNEPAILHEIPFSADNLGHVKALLEKGREDELYAIKPADNFAQTKSAFIVSYLSNDAKTYFALLHENPAGLGLYVAGIWEMD